MASRAFSFLFFLSGAAALIFETLWFRQAGLLFGNSVWASSLVTASFMAGLALGGALAGRRGAGLERPLLGYVGLECAVALTGAALVFGFPLLGSAAAPWLQPLLERPLALNAVRLAGAFLLLLVPCTAMGATLPVLVRGLAGVWPDFGPRLARLYGWNTLGAMAGALLGEMWLLERFGLRRTGLVAALLDLLAAGGAFALLRGLPAAAPAAPGPEVEASRPPLSGAARCGLGAAAASGALLLALEVVWFRFLQLFVNGTSLTFSVMLATVLAGIAGGGLLASAWLRRRPDASTWVPQLALAGGTLTGLAYGVFRHLLAWRGGGLAVDAQSVALLSAALMLPTCLVSGLLFTLLGKALRPAVGEDARAAGALTVANTVGTLLGALGAGFLMLPRLGMERAFLVLAAGYGVVALLARPLCPPRPRGGVAATLVAAAAWATCLLAFPHGVMERQYLRLSSAPWATDGSRMLLVREGLTETIVYLRRYLWGQPLYHRLVTNSFSMSSTGFGNRRYMNLFVYLPMALRPQSRRALLISYGVGSTAKALTDTRTLAGIDVVDISREILEAGRVVFPEGFPLDDPRVRVHVEDGRFFLLATGQRFDLITAEPPPPKNSGVVSLYTREHFQLVHDHLVEGGVATYWLPVVQLTVQEAKSVTAAFCAAFADCTLWTGMGPEWVLAGSRGAAGGVAEADFLRQWQDPVVQPTLATVGLEYPELLGTAFLADAAQLAEWTRGVAPLEDDHPYRLSPASTGLGGQPFVDFMAVQATQRRFEQSAFISRHWPAALRERTLRWFPRQEVINRYAWRVYGLGETPRLPELAGLLAPPRLRSAALWLMGSNEDVQRLARVAAEAGVEHAPLHEHLGVGALAAGDPAGAAQHLQRAEALGGEAVRLRQWRAFALCQAGALEEARALIPPREGAAGWLESSCAGLATAR